MIVLGNTGGACIVTRGYGCPTVRPGELLEKAFEFLSKVDPVLYITSPASESEIVLSFALSSMLITAMTEKDITLASPVDTEALADSPIIEEVELESPVDLEVIILSFDP